jgi:hypothetical protein
MWTMILVANFAVATITDWNTFSVIAVLVNAFYVLWLVAKQLKGVF